MFVQMLATNEQVLPMVGELKNPPPGNRSSLFIRSLRFILMLKRVLSAGTEADSNTMPIDPTSSPTIGNTAVVGSLLYSINLK
jgi:hypothetical protein